MVNLEALLKKIRGKKLMDSDKWSYADYVIIKICVM